jgi:hypothetical protein
MVPTVVTSYPDVVVLCPVVSCMTLVLTMSGLMSPGSDKYQNCVFDIAITF